MLKRYADHDAGVIEDRRQAAAVFCAAKEHLRRAPRLIETDGGGRKEERRWHAARDNYKRQLTMGREGPKAAQNRRR